MRLLIFPALSILLQSPLMAQYSVHRAGDVVQLEDSKAQTVVSILPSVGDIAFAMKVRGQNVLRFPYDSVEEFKNHPTLCGIPFIGPWANRLDQTAFYANGKKYDFNMDLGNVRGPHPIHGFLTDTRLWHVVELQADGDSAWLTSQLDFYREPDWMAQFPFAHTVQITYRLKDGVLEVQTRIHNESYDPMPVAIGFHPFFNLTDSKRDDWTISIGARKQWMLASDKIPTGETRPIGQMFPDPKSIKLKDYNLDDVFGDLIRDGSGRAVMSVKGKSQEIQVLFGPHYPAVVVWAPVPKNPPPANASPANRWRGIGDGNFVCFEPMAGITDALNLAQKGLYKELQSIPPGQTWQASFWVKPIGF